MNKEEFFEMYPIGGIVIGSDGEEYVAITPAPCGPEDDFCQGKDSHRGPKIRGKGKKAYRGSL